MKKSAFHKQSNHNKSTLRRSFNVAEIIPNFKGFQRHCISEVLLLAITDKRFPRKQNVRTQTFRSNFCKTYKKSWKCRHNNFNLRNSQVLQVMTSYTLYNWLFLFVALIEPFEFVKSLPVYVAWSKFIPEDKENTCFFGCSLGRNDVNVDDERNTCLCGWGWRSRTNLRESFAYKLWQSDGVSRYYASRGTLLKVFLRGWKKLWKLWF